MCYTEMPTGMRTSNDIDKQVFGMQIEANVPDFDSVSGIELEGIGLPSI
jgi:hypothetical protein